MSIFQGDISDDVFGFLTGKAGDAALRRLEAICADPSAQLAEALGEGKKVVGVMPYFCPEELVYAAGMLPFGLWGAELQANESKRYFPAFFCSILHTTLELGLRGKLDGLSAILVPASCDALKSMAANWRYGVGEKVPVIEVSYAQNRRTDIGAEYTRAQFRKVLSALEKIAGHEITDDDIRAAVDVYDENRAVLRAFSAAAAKHPDCITPAQRSAAIKAGFFMDRAAHTVLLQHLTVSLNTMPAQPWDGLRVVTTGILADSPALLKIFEENRIAIVDDQVAQESVLFRWDTPDREDPVEALALYFCVTDGCSVLYDPEKLRGKELVELAQEAKADGVIWLMSKFCDPEEFDYVPVKRMLDEAGIPLLSVEVDQQMVNYEQARSAIEAFAELLRNR